LFAAYKHRVIFVCCKQPYDPEVTMSATPLDRTRDSSVDDLADVPADSLERASAERVSIELVRLIKLMQAMRQHAPRLHPAVDAAAYPVLFQLAAQARRVSALAECVHSDISTVSRQVSTLVGHGLLEKVSDPEDGRAQVVGLSAEGHELLTLIQQTRTDWFAELMGDWTDAEATAFAGYLERFTTTLETAREQAIGRGRTDQAAPSPTTEPTTHITEH
jgi:DNA-binding MarR family transcriptional regulator